MTELHAVTRDRNDWSKKKPSRNEYLRYAANKSGRKPIELSLESARLQFGRGKLTLPEYVQYGVFERTHSRGDQDRFITNKLHWPIVSKCSDMTWQAATEDKWLCSYILTQSKIKVPETLAVIDKTDRAYPGTRKISTADDLRDFLNSQGALPCFAKENRGICSFGVFSITDADKDRVHLKGEGWLDYAACLDQFVGATPYLIQDLQSNHPFFDQYTESLATIRLYVLLTESGINIPFSCLKLPSRGNLADSFWRPGNLACNLDPKTGEILNIRSQHSTGTDDHAEHPETGKPILGKTVPLWDRVLDLAHNCAPIFRDVKFQSMDIAITKNGPVLIEINTGGGFDLPQLTSGKGFLTDEVREFLLSCGYKI